MINPIIMAINTETNVNPAEISFIFFTSES